MNLPNEMVSVGGQELNVGKNRLHIWNQHKILLYMRYVLKKLPDMSPLYSGDLSGFHLFQFVFYMSELFVHNYQINYVELS